MYLLDVSHKMLLQLFLISFCLFCSKIGKKVSIEISFNLMLLLKSSARFSYTSSQFQPILTYSWCIFKSFIISFFQVQNNISLS